MKNLMLEKKKIIINAVLAVVISSLLLVVAVLPAEYGIDPTGAGKLMGFDRLYVAEEATTIEKVFVEKGAIKEETTYKILTMKDLGSDPSVERPSEIDNPAPVKQSDFRNEDFTIDVLAGKGIEFKVKMKKNDRFKYEWLTDQGVLFHDMHAEINKQSKYFESYAQAYSNNMTGTHIAPFEGIHGWYFKNRSDKDIKVKLRLSGQFSIL